MILLIDQYEKFQEYYKKHFPNLIEKFIIVGIGINLIKSPKIKSYPTTNILDLSRCQG